MTRPLTAPFVAAQVRQVLEALVRGVHEDACPDVEGGTAPGVQVLLMWLAAHLQPGMAYLEVGSWLGKSIIPAARAAPPGVHVHACDIFSDPGGPGAPREEQRVALYENLRRHGVLERVHVHGEDFRVLFASPRAPRGVGVYFYDADHCEEAQYAALALAHAHGLLLPGAVVVVDDWLAKDGGPSVRAGTLRAARDTGAYSFLGEVTGGGQWWQGLGVFQYEAGGVLA